MSDQNNEKKNNHASIGLIKKHEVKQWSRLVGSSKNDLSEEKSWPSLSKSSNLDKNVSSPNGFCQQKSFLNALQGSKQQKYEKSNRLKVQNNSTQPCYDKLKDEKEEKQNPAANLSLELLNNNSLDENENWETVCQKKSRKSGKSSLPKNKKNNSDPSKDNKTDSKVENNTEVQPNGKNSLDKKQEKTEAKQKSLLRKQMFKERQQQRQFRILQEREAARRDTKVNVVSSTTVETILKGSKINKKKTQNVPKFDYKTSDYPSLGVGKVKRDTSQDEKKPNIAVMYSYRRLFSISKPVSQPVQQVTDTKLSKNVKQTKHLKDRPNEHPMSKKMADPIQVDLISYIKVSNQHLTIYLFIVELVGYLNEFIKIDFSYLKRYGAFLAYRF